MRRPLPAAAVVLVAVAASVAAFAQDAVGKPARTFPATDVLGMAKAKDPLLSLRGRAVLVVFFATHYARCAEAVPDMNKLNDKLGPRGLSFLWVTEEERAAVQALERTAVHAVVEALYTIPALHAANPKNLAHSFHPPAGPVISP